MSDGGTGRGGARRTVALLMTDVAGSSALWRERADAMSQAIRRHHELVEQIVREHSGLLPPDQGEGDSRLAVFETARAAAAAALHLQAAMVEEPWPGGLSLRVRMGLHAGEVLVHERNVFGETVNRCARVRGLASGGQILLSETCHDLVRDQLPPGTWATDLGEHRMRDVPRPERIHQLGAPGLPDRFPPLASLGIVRHNLGSPLSTFVGRERELDDLEQLLGDERLVTIVGPGGVGKTRIALHLAHRLLDGRFPDGVFAVDLAPLTDPSLVPTTIAEAVGVWGTDEAGSEAALGAFLRERRMLLVLDNAEHVITAAPAIARLVSSAPLVTVLVTSRQPLRVAGEREYQLGTLSAPRRGEGETSPVDTYDAVRLFIDRARSARRDFAVTNDSAPAVAAICARLDGLPLAIELAAARVTVLSPQRLLERLEQSLGVLAGGGRDLPARHQTLTAAIAWSVDALAPAERRLLARLAVFRGGCDLDAVERVCGPDLGGDALEAVEALVDRSLLRRSDGADGEPRFTLLETVRQYAETLWAPEEERTVRDRHAQWCLELSEACSRAGAAAYSILQLDRDNLRVALDHLHATGRHEDELLLAADQAVWWGDVGAYDEAPEVLRRVVAENPPSEPRAHCEFVLADMLRFSSVDPRGALAEAAAAALAAGATALTVAARITQVWTTHDLLDAEVGPVIDECRALLETVPAEPGRWFDRATASWFVESLSGMREARRESWAGALRSLAAADSQAGTRLTANARVAMGWVRYELGDDAGAAAALEEVLELSRAQGMLLNTCSAELYLGLLDLDRGDVATAGDRAARLERLQAETGYTRALANAALLRALAARESGRWEEVLAATAQLPPRPFGHWAWGLAAAAVTTQALAETGALDAAGDALVELAQRPGAETSRRLVEGLSALVSERAGDDDTAAVARGAAEIAPHSGHRLLRRLADSVLVEGGR